MPAVAADSAQHAILDAAASAQPSAPGAFQPTEAHQKLAATLFETTSSTFVQLAESAGISRSTLWRILKDKAACAWIVANATNAAAFGLGAVHARLLQMALTSRSPEAIRLYLQRFDPDFSAGKDIGTLNAPNSQIAFVASMSPAELEAFLKQKRRTVIGEPCPAALSLPTNPT